jgi:hypothetical protein
MDEPVSLLQFVNKTTLSCLNQDLRHPAENLLQSNEDLVLASDPSVDHQLVIRFEFLQPVKVAGVLLRGKDEESRPTQVKLFTNKPSLDFADAEDSEPLQALDLSAENPTKFTPVRFVKFQNLTSMQIYVEENGGSDVTQISKFDIFGFTAEKMDMNSWAPCKS